jgi:glucose-1-phosphate cytidylyltransferase
MRYYAHFGHKDFILCLGYRGDLVRKFFLNYDSYLDRDFTMTGCGTHIEPSQSDIADWRITFVDTGLHANLGERLVAVRKYLRNEEVFLANYSDQVSDLPLNSYIESAISQGRVATFLSVRPSQSYHAVVEDGFGHVKKLVDIQDFDFWINGGYFVLRQDIFNYIEKGEELVHEPFARLAEADELWTQKFEGFWKSMDTFKDKIAFDRMDGVGQRPWCVWGDSE